MVPSTVTNAAPTRMLRQTAALSHWMVFFLFLRPLFIIIKTRLARGSLAPFRCDEPPPTSLNLALGRQNGARRDNFVPIRDTTTLTPSRHRPRPTLSGPLQSGICPPFHPTNLFILSFLCNRGWDEILWQSKALPAIAIVSTRKSRPSRPARSRRVSPRSHSFPPPSFVSHQPYPRAAESVNFRPHFRPDSRALHC